MKITYCDLMNPGFGLLFNVGCDTYEDALKIEELKDIVMAHLKTFDGIKEKMGKSLGLNKNEIVTERHPKFPVFFNLMSKEVEIEVKEKIKIKFIKGLSGTGLTILRNFVEFIKGKENEVSKT